MNWVYVLRTVHMLTGALWLGSAALLTLYIMPAIRNSGVAGSAVLVETIRRGLVVFMPSIAGVTILSGLWLYWIWSGARGGVHGTGAILLTLGALCAVAGAIIGGAVIGRTVIQIADLAAASADAGSAARIAALHARGAVASRILLTLLVAAFVLMSISGSF